ncbi:MAG: class I SAM-dependent methyltransferase [Acidobacteriaceae bacterium]
MASVEHLPEIHEPEVRSDIPAGPPPRFDRVAHLYRIMEYLSFGPMLERCRYHYIAAIARSRPAPKRALVLGDGDGRFLARLLAAAPHLHADAIEASPAMLRLLRARIARLGAQSRLTTTCADARTFAPSSTGYDLVCTHFFLDCLTALEANHLIAQIRPHLMPGAQWLVSEFQIPSGSPLPAWLARAIVSALYAAFRLLTGLTVRQIPPWTALLSKHGFRPKSTHASLGGLLVSELWEVPQATASRAPRSHS